MTPSIQASPPSPAVALRRPAGSARKLQGAVDLFEQDLAVEGLGQVAEDATRGGIDGIRNIAVRGEQDDRQGRPRAADFLEQREAVLPRQANVADHHARIDGNLHQRLFGRAHRRHPEAARLQAHGQQRRMSSSSSTTSMRPRRAAPASSLAPDGTRPWRQRSFDVGQAVELVLQFADFALAILQLLPLLVELPSSFRRSR
jgi:hypothetical protein